MNISKQMKDIEKHFDNQNRLHFENFAKLEAETRETQTKLKKEIDKIKHDLAMEEPTEKIVQRATQKIEQRLEQSETQF